MATETARKPRSPFAEVIREALEETGVSIRELARRISDGYDMEDRRRLLTRYMSGEVSPRVETRNQIADALGLPRERFAENRDDHARRRRVMDALTPLADVLLAIAAETRMETE